MAIPSSWLILALMVLPHLLPNKQAKPTPTLGPGKTQEVQGGPRRTQEAQDIRPHSRISLGKKNKNHHKGFMHNSIGTNPGVELETKLALP